MIWLIIFLFSVCILEFLMIVGVHKKFLRVSKVISKQIDDLYDQNCSLRNNLNFYKTQVDKNNEAKEFAHVVPHLLRLFHIEKLPNGKYGMRKETTSLVEVIDILNARQEASNASPLFDHHLNDNLFADFDWRTRMLGRRIQ